MRKLYLIFNMVKLTAAFEDLIPGQWASSSLDSVVIDREEEWEVEYILNS